MDGWLTFNPLSPGRLCRKQPEPNTLCLWSELKSRFNPLNVSTPLETQDKDNNMQDKDNNNG